MADKTNTILDIDLERIQKLIDQEKNKETAGFQTSRVK